MATLWQVFFEGEHWKKISGRHHSSFWQKKMRSKQEVIDEGRQIGKTVRFATLMDSCHLRTAESEEQIQNYKGHVSLRGMLWKTIQALMQNLLNKDHPQNKWQHPKFWTQLPDFWDAQDKLQNAVWACTQVKMEDASKMLRIVWRKSMPNGMDSLTRNHATRKNGKIFETLWYLLKRICMVTHWQDYHGEDHLDTYWLEIGGRKFQIGNAWSMHRQEGSFPSVYDNGIKMRKERPFETCVGTTSWNRLTWKNPRIYWIKFSWHALQKNASQTWKLSKNSNLFETLISAGPTKQLPCWDRSRADTIAWSFDMESHAKTCVER